MMTCGISGNILKPNKIACSGGTGLSIIGIIESKFENIYSANGEFQFRTKTSDHSDYD